MLPSPPNLEFLAIKLFIPFPIIFCSVYIPPSTLEDVYLSYLSAFNQLLCNDLPVIITGDFNSPDIDWDCLSARTKSSHLFCDFVFEHNLSQLVTNATHTKGNILDLVLTNQENLICNLTVDQTGSSIVSDHYVVFFSIQSSVSHIHQPSSHYILDYSKANMSSFNDYLLDQDYHAVFSSTCINEAWFYNKEAINSAIDRFVLKFKLKPL